jgi:hypothetical protein
MSPDEERVALRLLGDGAHKSSGHVMLGEGGDQLLHLLGAEPGQVDPLVLHLPAQGGQGVGEGMVRADFGVPEGPVDEDPAVGGGAGYVAQHGDRAPVGPMEVLQAHQYGRPAPPGHQELGGRVEEAEAFLVGLDRGRIAHIGEDLTDAGDELGQGTSPRTQIGAELVGLGGAHLRVQSFGEGGVGRGPLALQAVAPQHEHPVPPGPLGQLFGEPGLADARLSRHHHQPPLAGGRLPETAHQAPQLCLTTDEVGARRQARPRLHLVADLEGPHRVGDTLQLQLAEIGEGEPGPATRKEPDHHLGAEDLAAVGPITQTAGDDDGETEVVRLVPDGLTGVESHPDGEALAVDRPAGLLLHGHGAAQGVERGGEGNHEPVAQPLDLLPTMDGGRLGEQVVVGPKDLPGVFITGSREQLRRPDQVGEEDRDER